MNVYHYFFILGHLHIKMKRNIKLKDEIATNFFSTFLVTMKIIIFEIIFNQMYL